MGRRRHASAGGLLVLCLSIPTANSAAANEAVGYVAALEAPAELVRASKIRALALGETIFRGDTVSIKPPNRLRIDTRAGPVWICGPAMQERDCRRTFDGSSIEPLGPWWSRIQAMITWFHTTPTNVVTRSGEAPVILLGRNTPQKILAGPDGLSVSWSHGQEPFVVRLSASGRVLAQGTSASRAITLPASLPLGSLKLTVEDREKRTAVITLAAVATGPKIPDMAASAVDSDHKTLLEAAWLADQEKGSWLFEAYRRVGTIVAKVPAAAAFRQALALGEKP